MIGSRSVYTNVIPSIQNETLKNYDVLMHILFKDDGYLRASLSLRPPHKVKVSIVKDTGMFPDKV